MSPLTEKIQQAAAPAPAPQEQPGQISSFLNDIIAASEVGSAARANAVQMKTDFVSGLLYARGTSASKKTDPADIAMRIRFGRDLGLTEFQAARGIYFINGVPAMMGTVIELLMRRHGYGWQFVQRDTKGCILRLTKGGVVVMDGDKPAIASFNEEDAKRMKKDKKDTYMEDPESMYYWRALGRLQKFYCPEVTDYVSVLAPGEVPIEDVVTETESRMVAATTLADKLAEIKGAAE